MEQLKSIGVLGAGLMGTGIAQTILNTGSQVVVYDAFESALDQSYNKIEANLQKLFMKSVISLEQKQAMLSKLQYTQHMGELSHVSMVIEAVPEDKHLKAEIYQKLCAVVDSHCVIASNTSSFSITELSKNIEHPNRFLGLHFFNPAFIMPLVELISGIHSDHKVVEETFEMVQGWGKTVVKVKDTPGFIVNRVARPFYCEALKILEEGIADVATIDAAMKNEGGFRMGPFELMDLIGLDTNFAITSSLFEAYYFEPRYKPSIYQASLVKAGLYGKKTEVGFYDYSENAVKPLPCGDKALQKKIFERILCCLMNEAADAFYYRIASKEDLDLAITQGVNYPKGLLTWLDEFGPAKCMEIMDSLFEYYHDSRYRLSPWIRKKVNGDS